MKENTVWQANLPWYPEEKWSELIFCMLSEILTGLSFQVASWVCLCLDNWNWEWRVFWEISTTGIAGSLLTNTVLEMSTDMCWQRYSEQFGTKDLFQVQYGQCLTD